MLKDILLKKTSDNSREIQNFDNYGLKSIFVPTYSINAKPRISIRNGQKSTVPSHMDVN